MRYQSIANFVASEDAVTAIEYALLGVLIVVVILGAVTLVGSRTVDFWQWISSCVEEATTSSDSCT